MMEAVETYDQRRLRHMHGSWIKLARRAYRRVRSNFCELDPEATCHAAAAMSVQAPGNQICVDDSARVTGVSRPKSRPKGNGTYVWPEP